MIAAARTHTWAAHRAHWPRLLRRFSKFGLVGASGACVNLLLFSICTTLLDLHYLVASLIAIEVSLTSNFILNNNWTFQDRRASFMHLGTYLRYHIVSLGNIVFNLTTMHFLVTIFVVPLVLGNSIGIGDGISWNFLLHLC
jgi:dolichol-phosphate mannosyltransferase